jgi:NAD(P)-dependent dehydrogenase (short-subunit alcohol dehydrogenase family)
VLGDLVALGAKTILITGATDGLGRAMAERLAPSGARLLVHGRDEERGVAIVEQLRASSQNERIDWLCADLASLEHVRALAREIGDRYERLDVLINNAGIGTVLPGGGRRVESEDGFELRFAVNYLACYLLTRLLLDRIRSSAPARIVSVSSAGQAPIDFDDVMLERHYEPVQAYCQSKLAQVMLTFDLAEELEGQGVTATCLHPGTFMPTKMVHAAGVTPVSSLEEGVEATLRLAVDEELEGVTGAYYNGLHRASPHPQATELRARRLLHELSNRLCGLQAP